MFPVILLAVNDDKLAPEPINNVDVTVPFTSNVVVGFVFPIPNLLFVLSHVKLAVCITLAPPINNCPDVKVVKPVPP